MANQIEHANIRVKDIDQTMRFLTTALLNFIVRQHIRRKPVASRRN